MGLDKHAQKLAAAHRSAWSRKVKSGNGATIALDALSQHTRGGGTLVTHETHGTGAVTHATEMIQRGVSTITATVLFEDRTRTFAFLGDHWAERPWTFG
jgi:hypothetical protein